MQRLRPYAVEIALAALIAVGVLVWWPLVHLLPWGADATKWVAHGSLDNPRWWTWATGTKHFVGYRPVTALAFVGNHALTGYAAWGYSAFDLTLHATTGVLLFLLYRALTGDRGAWGLVPVLVLFGHPATEEVVPYVARRSYLLALAFGLAALVALLRSTGGRRWAWATASALLLGLAVLSNEVAYVLLPLVVVTALDRGGWRALPRALPAAAVCAAAVARRHDVLGVWGGGYQKRFFAFVRDGVPMWRERTEWDPAGIAEACWRYLLVPNGVGGGDPLFPGVLQAPAAIGLGAWLAVFGLALPLRRWRTPEGRLPLGLAAWLVGGSAIVVLSQTWFWRQAYTLLPPLGMLAAVGLRTAWDTRRAHPAWAWTGLAGGAALVLAVLWNGPLVRGANTGVHTIRFEGTRVALILRDRMAELEGPGAVFLVVPLRASAAHIVRLWGDRFGTSRRIETRLLGHLAPGAAPRAARLEIEDGDDGRPRIRLVAALQWSQLHPYTGIRGKELAVDRIHSAARKGSWLVAIDADEAWTIRAETPDEGVVPLPDVPVAPPPDDEEAP